MIGSGKTLVALYDDFADAEEAMFALDAAGVPRDDTSLVTHDADRLRRSPLSAAPYASPVGRTAQPFVGGNPVVAGGPMGPALGGTGSVTGALGFLGVPVDEAREYEDGVAQGGALVVARLDADADIDALRTRLGG